ncbi:hypothetical protein [uncultured Propionibacterium sp.]|uniref:hypothetical protein n=1 Tax=uncultured Propionibacterium sp. TaxID=218066 RepID=UPI00292FAAD7|nr:hypothetical protein [uncultured Propionibacterium sp.]
MFCGQCGSRLLLCHARSGRGRIYPYFACSARHAGRGDCTPAGDADRAGGAAC